ncbi:MAG: thiol-disulfide isomerase/thioredoxin [Bacteroidia bacterium]|jgi:thiol-disulfide isomerase/thioredoxin
MSYKEQDKKNARWFAKRLLPVILFTVIALTLGRRIADKISEKESKAERISEIPKLNFFTLDSSAFRNTQLVYKKSAIFIHFNTTCSHCQYEAEELAKSEEALAGIAVYMISNEPIQFIEQFSQEYALNNSNSVTFLKANQNQFFETFGSSNVPDVFIYNSEGKLTKHYSGETKIEAIIKASKM